jgi:hypothetical protein
MESTSCNSIDTLELVPDKTYTGNEDVKRALMYSHKIDLGFEESKEKLSYTINLNDTIN